MERREKEKWTNKGTDKQCVADSLTYNLSLSSFVPNFRIFKSCIPEKSLKKKREKEKWTNKGTDLKQYVADSLIHSTNCST